MSRHLAPVALAQELIRFNTVNPPGQEEACAEHIGAILEDAGFRIRYHPLSEGRPNLIARIGGNADKPALCLTGHTDVVPLGAKDWSFDPFCGEIEGDRLLGRGSTDMKGGVAAIVGAAVALADRLDGTPGLELVITADEETGTNGARMLARQRLLGRAGAIVVAEPTANALWLGHKGVLRFDALARGVTAHSAMPEEGVNAIYKATRAINALQTFDFTVPAHPVLGAPTLNVGWIEGGLNVNSVPDRAAFGVDIRVIPGVDLPSLKERLRETVGPEIEVTFGTEAEAVWTEPDEPWIAEMREMMADASGNPPPLGAAAYFTDGSALREGYGGPPTIILGPGEPRMAHQTDEFCYVSRIEEATELYTGIIRRWCGL
ncbi:MAG: M20 family metallopeptidase [Dichotomicrobium sp.]